MNPLNNLCSISGAWGYNFISRRMSGILISSIGCSWRLSALVICSKSHQVCNVFVQESGL